MPLLIMSHSDLFADVGSMSSGWPQQFFIAVVAQSRGKGRFQVFVAAEAFEGDALACSLLLVVDVVGNDHHDFLYLVLNEQKGSLYFLLVRLLGYALADDLNPFSQSLLLSIEAIRRHLLLELILKCPILSLEHRHHILYQLFIHPSFLHSLHLQCQICDLALFLVELPTKDVQLVSKQGLVIVGLAELLLEAVEVFLYDAFDTLQFE